MMFKTIDGELKVFNKTILSTQNNLKNLQSLQNAQPQTVSNFTKLNNAFKVYNGNLTKSTGLQNAYIKSVGGQNQALGNYLAGLNGAKASMGGYIASLVKAKLATIGLQAASMALNMALSMGVVFAIQGFIKLLDKWIVTSEEAREKSQELTQAWKEENDVIDESISKYQELSKALKDESLTESEVARIKEDLSSVQDTLNEKFKDEIKDVDLVNGKYEEQLATLKELSKEKARDYVRENKNNIEGDKNYLNDIIMDTTGGISNGKVGYKQRSDNDFSDRLYYSFGFRDETVVSPTTTLNDSVGFDLESILNKYENIYAEYDASAKEYRLRFKGIRDNVYNDLKKFYNDLSDLENDGVGGNISSIIDTVGDSLNNEKLFDEDKISQSKQNIIDYAEAEILGNTKTNDLYYDATLAVEQYNEALASDKGIEEAKANLDEVQGKVNDAFGKGGILADINGAQDVFDKLWNSVSEGAKDTAESIDKIDVSLDSYKKASEGISSLATAFKELTDSEYVSLETISKIKEAVGDSVSNWGEYEQKLLSVKKGTAEYNQLMRELTYATLEKQLGGVKALANADEKYVAQLLKENGVLNANEVAHGAVERAKAKELVQSKTSNQETVKTIESLIQEANSAGISTNAYLELTAKEILFNNNTLDTSQKCQQILAIASAAGVASTAYSTLTNQINAWASKDLIGSGTRTDTATKLGMTVINEKNRGKDGKGKGNLYVASDGIEFEDYKDAMYYQESLNNVSKISDAYSNTNFVLPDYSGAKTTSKDTKETFDWIETKISRLQRTITNFGKTVSATWKSWTDRNSALKSQISAVTSEINLQQQAANKYLSLANGVGLSGTYKELVRNGSLNISTITDENTINAIKQYQEYYNAYLVCLDAKQDAENELANLVREDFDMIAKQFDSEISLVEENMGIIEAYIDQSEMKGNLVSKNYYSAMYAEEEKNLSLLQQKYDQLSNKLSNGTVKQGSEEFNEMAKEIKEVSKAIIESNTAIEEYQKTMRELDWEVFDLIEEKIGNVTEESEFLIDLLSNSKLFNNDGSITSQGQATLGLHVANLKIYESQVSDYAQAIADLDKEFANDSLDQNYLERRTELVDLQRDLILQAQEEKNSIKDLMSQGYDSLLSYMDELIAKRKSLLSQASDARSFQKTVQEQTDEISRLQNIINSYNGDLSEESKSAIQKYEVQLKEAESNLEDTLYDQYISDTEKMLDLLVEDTENIISKRLDNTDGIISDVVQKTEENTSAIKETLVSEVSNVGGTISTAMETIWSGTDGVKGVIGGVNNTLLEIKNLVQSMVKGSDTEASKNASGATSDVKPVTKPATPSSTSNSNNSSSTSAKAITVGGMINASGALIYDYAGDKSGERQYFRNSPYYRVLDERNGYLKVRHQSLSSGTTGWFKKSDIKAYATGGKVDYTGLAMVHGSKSKPELMLNAKDTENFIALKDALSVVAKTNMFDAIGNYAKMPNFVPNGNVRNSGGDVIFEKIEMYGVNDPQEFAKQLKEVYDRDIGNVRKMINTDVHSKYGSHNYRRYL